MKTSWAKSLIFNENEEIELRVAAILRYIAEKFGRTKKWTVREVDAIGKCGSTYTKRINEEKEISLDTAQLIELFNEGGQVIEFAGHFSEDESKFELIIRDGYHVDLLSKDIFIPDSLIGKYEVNDGSLFYW